MIDRKALLDDLQRLLETLEEDLRERCREAPEIASRLQAAHEAAAKSKRTGMTFEEWRAGEVTQTAVAWVLSAVFVRFLEDNRLVDPPRIAGPVLPGAESRLQRARDEHEVYVRRHPEHSDREFLQWVFQEVGDLPAGREIFGKHNPIHEHSGWLSGDGARAILEFFQRIDPKTGLVVHDFTDPEWGTRFLGDLYQDLSEAARNRYALLQTPEFIEEFILDRTLDPALEEFGLKDFRMIDPACGSGHFLLGAFRRLLERWQRAEPGANPTASALKALAGVHGVDLNPFAVAIARFRLLLAAIRAAGFKKLKGAPEFPVQIVCGDSLYHGSEQGEQSVLPWDTLAHAYFAEDRVKLHKVLRQTKYHTVVANPPYITPKDRALNAAYRKRFPSCSGKYSLSVPFLEEIFDLAVPGGFTGQITANSFMKREFGKKLIEKTLPKLDLTHVIDTSGAYIPGHGTPTVVLFGRNRKPVSSTIRAVMGIRGEPSTPEDASRGLVWSSICKLVDQPGAQSEFVSVADVSRERFAKHPWSIGGGGAAEFKELLDERATTTLRNITKSIGITSFTLEDDVFILPDRCARRRRIPEEFLRVMVEGDAIRDWTQGECDLAVFPYDASYKPIAENHSSPIFRYLWTARTCLANSKMFGGLTKLQAGLRWYEFGRLTADKLRTPLSIVFAFVATHNHFVLDRGGKVFKQSAPVIKLKPEATEEDHLALLGLLNSSTACFWMKQVMPGKHKGDGGNAHADPAYQRFEFDGTKLENLPLCEERPVTIAKQIDSLARQAMDFHPGQIVKKSPFGGEALNPIHRDADAIRQRLITLQEELDWKCYHLYQLADEDLAFSGDPPPILIGQRAFEIALAREVESGNTTSSWFERHRSTPITEIPMHWPEAYRQVVERRIHAIETNPHIQLIEQPEYKRRWNTEPWDDRVRTALHSFLLDRLETYFDHDGRMNDVHRPTVQMEKALVSTAKLADLAARDPKFLEAAEVYRGRADFDVARLVEELVEGESVALLPVLRYTASGLEKRAAWERTWQLQREEDAREGNARGDSTSSEIPVPPKYQPKDFLKSRFWSLRGKLDVPKERWVSFPHCEGEDQSIVIAWAGLNHLELARAVSAHYVLIQEKLGGRDDPRLPPLLAALLELLPWIRQWHNEIDPEFGMRMGDYFSGFVEEEARAMEKTIDEIRAWRPPERARGRKKQKEGSP